MRLIWSELAAWSLFFLGKDLVLHFKQFRFDGATFFNYIQHSKMQHFCSIFRLNKCIWESWLSVVFVVCPLGGNVPKHLFWKNWGLLKAVKLEKLEKADFAHFVSCPLDGNVHKDLFWQNCVILKALSLKSLKKQTLLIFWAARLVETYTKTSFDKIGGFWKF